MRDTYIGKVIYFKISRSFEGNDGYEANKLSEAAIYPECSTEGDLLGDFDKDNRDQAEIWKVKVTIDTV